MSAPTEIAAQLASTRTGADVEDLSNALQLIAIALERNLRAPAVDNAAALLATGDRLGFLMTSGEGSGLEQAGRFLIQIADRLRDQGRARRLHAVSG